MTISSLTRLSHVATLVAVLMLLACSAGEAKRLVVRSAPKVNPQNAAALKLAIADYKQGRYKDAVVRLEDVDRRGLCNEGTHYYIALCYQCMNQTVLAKMHYQWVLQYGRDATLRAYSQAAYQQLAYYQSHRTYSGQGNIFAVSSAKPYSRSQAVASNGFNPGFA